MMRFFQGEAAGGGSRVNVAARTGAGEQSVGIVLTTSGGWRGQATMFIGVFGYASGNMECGLRLVTTA